MASQTDIAEHIDLELWLLAADVADLDTVLEAWSSTSPHERMTFETEWRSDVARLDALLKLQQSGRLSRRQSAQMNDLVISLRSHAEVLRHYQLAVPACMS